MGRGMQHRKVISLVYLAAIGTLLACIFYFGWSLTWAVFVPEPLSPSFADLRVIQAAVTSASQGLNPQISNPGTSVLNYPLIWVKIGEILHFQNESRFIWICSLEVLCFVGFCVYLLHCFPSFGLLASLLSSATLFAIERGNSDLIIYCLVLLFVPIISKKLSIRFGRSTHQEAVLPVLRLRNHRTGDILLLVGRIGPNLVGYTKGVLHVLRLSEPRSLFFSA